MTCNIFEILNIRFCLDYQLAVGHTESDHINTNYLLFSVLSVLFMVKKNFMARLSLS